MAERSLSNDQYDTHGEITLAGSSNAYTGETARSVTGYYNGLLICAEANHDNTGAATLNLNGIGAGNIKLTDGSDPAAGNIQDGGKYFFLHDGTNFQLLNPYIDTSIAAGSVGTTELADEAVTYAKMQHVSATSRVLGRKTAGAGDVEECTLSEVLDFIGSAAQGDILYRGSSGWARLGAGTSGQFLQTQGTGANPQWVDLSSPVTAIEAGALSSQATLDIDLSGGADMYEIDLISIAPANDTVNLYCRFSQSSTFLSGAADYHWNRNDAGSFVSDVSDSEIEIGVAGDLGNAAGETSFVTLRIYRPSASSFIKSIIWHGFMGKDSADMGAVQGGGKLIANTNAIDGVRFLFSAGDISSGYYAVRSYSFT